MMIHTSDVRSNSVSDNAPTEKLSSEKIKGISYPFQNPSLGRLYYNDYVLNQIPSRHDHKTDNPHFLLKMR